MTRQIRGGGYLYKSLLSLFDSADGSSVHSVSRVQDWMGIGRIRSSNSPSDELFLDSKNYLTGLKTSVTGLRNCCCMHRIALRTNYRCVSIGNSDVTSCIEYAHGQGHGRRKFYLFCGISP